jgi:predicted nucleic-acid-binding Zn-ribbon protein
LPDMTRPAPACPECGGTRYWYGSVEFWVGGRSRSDDDTLNAAVCGNCGYSSLYLQNMAAFRQTLTRMGVASPAGDPGDAPGASAASPEGMSVPRDRAGRRAFHKALREQLKSQGD